MLQNSGVLRYVDKQTNVDEYHRFREGVYWAYHGAS